MGWDGRGGQRWGEPLVSGAHRVCGRHTTLCGVPDPRVGVVGEGAHGGMEGSKVSEFWRVVGGLQLVVARDGGSTGCVSGAEGGTGRGAVLGPGKAKEVAEPGGDLAVGEGRDGWWLREVYN